MLNSQIFVLIYMAFLKKKILFIYLRERERAHTTWGRGRGRDSQADSPLSTELEWGSIPGPWDQPWAEGRHLTDWTTQVAHLSNISFKKRFYLFIWQRERGKERAQAVVAEEAEGEADSLLSRGLTWGWIPGPWDHALSRRQTLNRCATQAPQVIKS